MNPEQNNQEDLEKSLVKIGTFKETFTEVKGDKIYCTLPVSSPYIPIHCRNKIYLKNIRIKGLSKKDFIYISLEIGRQIIISFYSWMYDIILLYLLNKVDVFSLVPLLHRKFKGINENIIREMIMYYCNITRTDDIIIPIDVMPLVCYHISTICICSGGGISIDNCYVEYDMYYTKNPLYNTLGLNTLQLSITQYYYNQDCIRLNINGYVNILCVKYKNKIKNENKLKLKIDSIEYELKPHRIINGFHIYKFKEYIYFSEINNIKITGNGEMHIEKYFTFNFNLLITRGGMCGTKWSF
jgi:hypothetical protein